MKTKLSVSNYRDETENRIYEVTRESLEKPAWVGGVMLTGLADQFEVVTLTAEFLAREIKALESWRELDGHTWGAFENRAVEDQASFARILLARKAGK